MIHDDFRRVKLFENSRRLPHSLQTPSLLGQSWLPMFVGAEIKRKDTAWAGESPVIVNSGDLVPTRSWGSVWVTRAQVVRLKPAGPKRPATLSIPYVRGQAAREMPTA